MCIRDSSVSIATGVAAAEEIRNLSKRIIEASGRAMCITVYAIENRFFGGQVNVTGLLTAHDLLEQLAGLPLGDCLLLSRSMFRSGTEVLLDDVTRTDMEDKLGQVVQIVHPDGASLALSLIHI